MNKQPSYNTMRRCWGVFFLALLLLAFQVIPCALGQRDAAKPKATVNLAAAGRQGDVRPLPPNAPKFPALSTFAPAAPISKATGISKRVSEVLEGTSGPTGMAGGCQFGVLIVYADNTGLPTQLQSEILAEPNATAVDLFDAISGAPTLAQLQQYDIVVPFSNSPFLDGDTLGNNLADYVDGGGVVVQYGFAHYGPGEPYGVNGRWVTGGYNPYDYSTNLETRAFSLGTFDAGHPLMAGVTTLNSNYANIVTPNAAATEVAQNIFGESLVAFRPVSGGHTTVGVTAYVGAAATQSGDWGRVVVNAGNWLRNCQGITLDAQVRRQGGNRFVVLNWSPSNGDTMNVLRNGTVIGTTDDDGSAQKNIHMHTGTDTYQVCETDTGACSNVVTVTTH